MEEPARSSITGQPLYESDEEAIRGWLVDADDLIPKISDLSGLASPAPWLGNLDGNGYAYRYGQRDSTGKSFNYSFKAVPPKEMKPSIDMLKRSMIGSLS